MTIWNFCTFGLKCLFMPQKFGFLGVWTPKRDWSSFRPQKAHPWSKPHLRANFGADRSTGAICAWDEEIKKERKKKARKESYSGKLGIRPDHPRWRSDMWSCMPGGLREVVISFKFRQNRLKVFEMCGVEICHFLYLRPVAYITDYRTSHDYKLTPIKCPA